MKKITFIILSLIVPLLSYGQLSLDFEDGTTNTQFCFNGTGSTNVDNPQVDAGNMSSRVLEITKPAGANWFAGCGFQENPGVALVNMADGDTFTVRIWSSKANVPFRVRLQADLDVANTAFNYDFTVTTANQWMEYTLDFSSQVNGTEQYREIVIQPDYDPTLEGPDGDGVLITEDGTYYIDDFVQVGGMVDPNTDATLSDLTIDGTTVAGFSPNSFSYNVELPNGTAMAPTVAGVATQAGNGSSNVNVTQAAGVPGTATVDVTAPNGTTTQQYTVNFTEADALPSPAPTPPSISTISLISDVFSNITIPQVDIFSGTVANVDLNNDNNDEAISVENSNGFQFNFFPGTLLDISEPAFMHLDFYADGLADNDNLRVRFLSQGDIINIARVQLSAAQSGAWVSVDLELPDGTNRNDFDDIDSAANSIDVTQLGLIQFNTENVGSTLNTKLFYLSNIYFYGGTLSTSDFNLPATFKVFPNPTHGDWTLSSNTTINKVNVYDILGKQVLSISPNTTETQINASTLRTGVYFARIESASGLKTVKLVKQ